MSTIDPRVARAQQQARAQASGTAAVGALVVAVIHAALWALAGYGIASQLDVFRMMQLNPVGSWSTGHEDDFWMLFAGILPGAFVGFILTGRVNRWLRAGSLGFPFMTAALGLAVGFTLFLPEWALPQRIGSTADELTGTSAWGPLEWIAYRAPLILPAVFALVFLLSLISLVRAQGRARAKAQGIRDMVAHGVRRVGRVSESTLTGVEVMGNPMARFTIHYTDATGIERWVTKTHTFPAGSVPRAGDVWTVWYDPARPDDQASIVVDMGDSDGTSRPMTQPPRRPGDAGAQAGSAPQQI